MSVQDILAVAPISVVAIFSLIVMLTDAISTRRSNLCLGISITGLVAGIVVAALTLGEQRVGFDGLIASGGMRNVFDILFFSGGILTLLLAREYLERFNGLYDEFYTLLMMSVAGMSMMAHATDFIILFVGLELMSICFYVLAGFLRSDVRSNEAGVKYFLLGAFASGFLLYGMALIYGSVGSTGYQAIVENAAGASVPLIFWAGTGLLVVGLAFKVAAVPFHQWAPDVYEGAPTVVTGFMSTAGKAAAFAGFLGVVTAIYGSGATGIDSLREVFAVLAVASMLVGNITAIAQTSVKRMLAYSSVAHAGYIMIGLAAGNLAGMQGIVYYLIAYLFMQLGAFAIVGILEEREGKNLTYDEYRGLGKRRPGLAITMALFMFALTGIPPFAGFFGKYQLFASAVSAEMTWLAIVGVVASVISVWFYLGLVVAMFFRDSDDVEGLVDTRTPGLSARTAVALTLAGTIIIGFLPGIILDLL